MPFISASSSAISLTRSRDTLSRTSEVTMGTSLVRTLSDDPSGRTLFSYCRRGSRDHTTENNSLEHQLLLPPRTPRTPRENQYPMHFSVCSVPSAARLMPGRSSVLIIADPPSSPHAPGLGRAALAVVGIAVRRTPAVARGMKLAVGPGAAVPAEGPEERELRVAPDQLERIGQDVAQPELIEAEEQVAGIDR